MQSSAPPLSKAPKGYSRTQQQVFTPEQLQLFQGMFGNVSPDSFLGKLAGGDQSQFDQLEAPAKRQFAEAQGGIASRFSGGTGQGSLGQRRGSGFQLAQNQGASDFAQKLQADRMGLQQNAIKDLMTMSGQLLGQRPYEQELTQNAPKSGGFGGFLSNLGGQAAGAYVGNYAGAAGKVAGKGIG